MKSDLLKTIKLKSNLMSRLKINKKSLKILDSINHNKNRKQYKSMTSRNNLNNILLQNNFNYNTNLTQRKKPTIKLVKNKSSANPLKQMQNINNDNFFTQSITERKNNDSHKLLINNKTLFRSRNQTLSHHNELGFPSVTMSHQNSKGNYTININKYKQIFESISSRIKSSYEKKSSSSTKIDYNKRFNSLKNSNYHKNKNLSYRKASAPKLLISKKFFNTSRSLNKLKDYENTLENEFNCKEFIKIEIDEIEKKLSKFKPTLYKKRPIFKTKDKLNEHLIREYNLDMANLKKSFNKKFKVYVNSLKKIKEIRDKKLFKELKKSHLFNINDINLVNEIYGYNQKNDFSNNGVRKALNSYYSKRTNYILQKKYELERELIDLNTEFRQNIEREKKINSNINYSELNQIIQTKLVKREVYETDISKKKREFYDEHTKLMHKTRKWNIANKVVKNMLREKTMEKFKASAGINFGNHPF